MDEEFEDLLHRMCKKQIQSRGRSQGEISPRPCVCLPAYLCGIACGRTVESQINRLGFEVKTHPHRGKGHEGPDRSDLEYFTMVTFLKLSVKNDCAYLPRT